MADFFNRRGGQDDDFGIRQNNNFDRRYSDDRNDYYNDRRSTVRNTRINRSSDERLNRTLPPIQPYNNGEQYAPVNNGYQPNVGADPRGAIPNVVQQQMAQGQMAQGQMPQMGQVANGQPQVMSMQNVVLFSPKSYGDVQTLIDHLRRREPAIVDFELVADESGQRILDFLSGAIYALGGSMQRVSNSIFLLTPAGITISAGGDIAKTIEDKRNKR